MSDSHKTQNCTPPEEQEVASNPQEAISEVAEEQQEQEKLLPQGTKNLES